MTTAATVHLFCTAAVCRFAGPIVSLTDEAIPERTPRACGEHITTLGTSVRHRRTQGLLRLRLAMTCTTQSRVRESGRRRSSSERIMASLKSHLGMRWADSRDWSHITQLMRAPARCDGHDAHLLGLDRAAELLGSSLRVDARMRVTPGLVMLAESSGYVYHGGELTDASSRAPAPALLVVSVGLPPAMAAPWFRVRSARAGQGLP